MEVIELHFSNNKDKINNYVKNKRNNKNNKDKYIEYCIKCYKKISDERLKVFSKTDICDRCATK